MPYSQKHKQTTRATIIEVARVLFNKNGFQSVTIDMIMETAGLTRGGFYNHFDSKEDLYCAAVASFLHGRGAQWREKFDIDPSAPDVNMVQKMIMGYLSAEHMNDLEAQCPMIALPSDIARSNPDVRFAYQELLEAMVYIFESGLQEHSNQPRQTALATAALCVGGMILARTLPNSEFANEVRTAAFETAQALTGSNG